ncbi:hypothetical protein BH23CHL5_BH23CHL5_08750 [soil metagenome]
MSNEGAATSLAIAADGDPLAGGDDSGDAIGDVWICGDAAGDAAADAGDDSAGDVSAVGDSWGAGVGVGDGDSLSPPHAASTTDSTKNKATWDCKRRNPLALSESEKLRMKIPASDHL